MDSQQGVVGAIRAELIDGQPATKIQCRVQSQCGVPLGQDETVSVGIVRAAGSQSTAVKRRQYSRDRKRRPDVSDSGSHRLFEHDPADLVCRLLLEKKKYSQSRERKRISPPRRLG